MNRPDDISHPSTENVSRRAALSRVVAVGLGLAGAPAMAGKPAVDLAGQPSEYIPENDYPFFGGEPLSE